MSLPAGGGNGVGGTPPGIALDQFLRNSYDLVQEVHANLAQIRAVAEHLTPVEDLIEFRNEITALHSNLGLLVAASHLILQATDAGLDMLTAVDAEAQRVLLGLKSAALREADYFATNDDLLALSAQVAHLSDMINQILTELATKVSRDELNAALARLGNLEDGVDLGLDQANARITLLISELATGYGFASATALDNLTTRVGTTETGLFAEAQRTTALQANVLDLANEVQGSASALNQLTVRVESSDRGIEALATNVLDLNTSVVNLATGQSAQSGALQTLTSRTSILEGTITSQASALTQLNAEIDDVTNQAQLNGTAISGLETRLVSNELGQTVISQQYDQLSARVLDTETGLGGQADAVSTLVARVTSTEGLLEVAAEERTSLRSSLTSTGNYLPNSSFAVNLRGWTLFSRGTGWESAILSRNLAPNSPNALPPGMNALSLTTIGTPSGNAGICSDNIPVEDLGKYILSGYLATQNCTLRMEWRILDEAGEEIGFGLVGQTNTPPRAKLSEWTRVAAPLEIPGDGRSLQVQLWVVNITGVPKIWFLRPMLEMRSGAQINPSPWADSTEGLETALATAMQSLSTAVTGQGDTLTVISQSQLELTARLEGAENDIALGNVARERAVAEIGGRISSILDDSIITPDEKPQLVIDYHTLINEREGIRIEAEASTADTEWQAYSDALDALIAYMSTLTSPVPWFDMSGDTLLT